MMKKTHVFLILGMLCGFLCISQSVQWQWAKCSENAFGSEGVAVAADPSGNIYFTGSFRKDTVTIDTITLYNPSQTPNVFIAKYSPQGRVIWARTASGEVIEAWGSSLVTDDGGNVYVTGYYSGVNVSFGSWVLPDAFYTLNNAFTVKYDSSGNVLWATAPTSVTVEANSSEGLGIAVGRNGDSYITGWFGGDSITFDAITLQHVFGGTLFIVKYDSSGNAVWGKSAGGLANGITVDGSDNVYITGE